MRDINFFAPYTKPQEVTIAQNATVAIASVLVVSIAASFGYSIFQLKALDKNIAIVNQNLTNEAFVEEYQRSQEVALEKGLLDTYNNALISVQDGILDRSMIDTAIIKQINSTIPSGANLKSLSIQGETITMNVTSKSDKEAADLKYNLDKLPMIKETFIPSINSDFGSPEEYSFSITCTLEASYYED